MQMRYFRFLYGKTQGCFLHLGELNDTKRNEKFTFLYMQGMDEHVKQEEADHTLFLYPKCVDLLVLGKADLGSVAAMKGLLEDIQVGMAVIPEVPEDAEELLAQSLRAEKVMRLKKFGESFRYSAAGWGVEVNCWREGALVMKHRPEELKTEVSAERSMASDLKMEVLTEASMVQKRNREDLVEGPMAKLSQEQTVEGACFDDCVMSIKEIENGCRCRKDCCPDEYGCALGCTRGRDYDMCKSRAEDQTMPYTIGTVLVAGDGNEEERAQLIESMKDETLGTRFFVSVDSEECMWLDARPERSCGTTEPRRYFIGTKLSDCGVGRICRGGLKNVPVVLQDEKGLCCSGFMKYCEAE